MLQLVRVSVVLRVCFIELTTTTSFRFLLFFFCSFVFFRKQNNRWWVLLVLVWMIHNISIPLYALGNLSASRIDTNEIFVFKIGSPTAQVKKCHRLPISH